VTSRVVPTSSRSLKLLEKAFSPIGQNYFLDQFPVFPRSFTKNQLLGYKPLCQSELKYRGKKGEPRENCPEKTQEENKNKNKTGFT
jgi:hypothetical protein